MRRNTRRRAEAGERAMIVELAQLGWVLGVFLAILLVSGFNRETNWGDRNRRLREEVRRRPDRDTPTRSEIKTLKRIVDNCQYCATDYMIDSDCCALEKMGLIEKDNFIYNVRGSTFDWKITQKGLDFLSNQCAPKPGEKS